MESIEQFVTALNTAWQEARFDDLRGFFDDAVVMQMPHTAQSEVGAEQMVASYRSFAEMATIHRFDITDIAVFDFGTTAMAHLKFEVDYEIDGERSTDRGMDIYAVRIGESGPKIVWRTQMSLP